MSIIVKSKFVQEDILNENGEKIGVIKFDPDDSTIMKALAEIISNLIEKIKEIDQCGEIDLPKLEKTSTAEEFEAASEELGKMSKMFKIEYKAVDDSISELEEIFGKETINCFTGGTHDIETLIPLVEFITPYIQKNRKEKVSKYVKNPNDVME